MTEEWTSLQGVVSPIRMKPAQAEIQHPDIEFEREREISRGLRIEAE
jgi:hypothetical protein